MFLLGSHFEALSCEQATFLLRVPRERFREALSPLLRCRYLPPRDLTTTLVTSTAESAIWPSTGSHRTRDFLPAVLR